MVPNIDPHWVLGQIVVDSIGKVRSEMQICLSLLKMHRTILGVQNGYGKAVLQGATEDVLQILLPKSEVCGCVVKLVSAIWQDFLAQRD